MHILYTPTNQQKLWQKIIVCSLIPMIRTAANTPPSNKGCESSHRGAMSPACALQIQFRTDLIRFPRKGRCAMAPTQMSLSGTRLHAVACGSILMSQFACLADRARTPQRCVLEVRKYEQSFSFNLKKVSQSIFKRHRQWFDSFGIAHIGDKLCAKIPSKF